MEREQLKQPQRRSWSIVAVLVTLVLGVVGCEGTEDEGVTCEPMTVEGREYCVAKKSITETGFDCPAGYPHRHSAGDLVVCSKMEDMPEGHREEIERRHNAGMGPDAGSDAGGMPTSVTKAELCGDPAKYSGKRITVPAGAVERRIAASANACPDDRRKQGGGVSCCSQSLVEFQIHCGDSGNEEKTIVLREAPGANFPEAKARAETSPYVDIIYETSVSFGCAGQGCYQVCTPGRLKELESFTGVFETNGPFSEMPPWPSIEEYGMKLDVESVVRAGDGCPDFASGCPSGCNEIRAKKLVRQDTCFIPTDVIGCTPKSGDGKVTCVKRVDNEYAHLYEVENGSTTEGTGWVPCTDDEEKMLQQSHPTCN